MKERSLSIKIILDKLYRHPLMQDVSLETVADYCVDFMRIVGCPNIFEEKCVTLNVSNYRANLPIDFYQMNQVRDSKLKEMYRYTTDVFHLGNKDNKHLSLTYKIQGNIIYTSKETTQIEISYQAISVDDDGFPLIPDNSSFTRALELYVKKQWFTILFDMGKIQGAVLQNVQQEYAWAVGDCQTEFNRLTLDETESFYNSWKTLIIRDREHRYGFKTNGSKEYLKLV